MSVVNIFNTDKKYSIICTDPPWPQSKGGLRKTRPNQGRELDYATMSMEEIDNLHRVVTYIMTDKHNVFMWAIDKYLHETERMMSDMGYKLHARFIWDKCNGVAPAFTVRFSHEYLLWFYLPGKMLMPDIDQRGKYMTVIREPATAHSRKPTAAYEMLEAMFPGVEKIELFARQERAGWDCWGNEVLPEQAKLF